MFLLGGCIKNDLPYPRIQPCFTAFMVEGESRPAVLDSATRTVSVFLGEEVDITNVHVLNYAITPEGSTFSAEQLPAYLDLSTPHNLVLSLYQDYEWTISATQSIERYIELQGQMGQPVIDVPGRRVVAYVPKGTDLTAIKVNKLKLGSTAATMSPDITDTSVDFTHPVKVSVTDYGRTTEWTIYVETVDASVILNSIDAWTRVAWLHATAEPGRQNGFEYRVAGTDEWIKVPAEYVTEQQGVLTARLIHLSPETTYEARAFSGLDVTAPQQFTTGTEQQLPNSNFDLWWLDGKIWQPWEQGGSPYWDTGNKGATTLGDSNVQPDADTPSGSGYSAMLRTEFKGIGPLGKLAAGSIYTGTYVKTDGTNGILHFGREFTQRPTRMTFNMRFHSAPISHVGSDSEFADFKGRPDIGTVYIALADWTEPFETRTNPRNRQIFTPDVPGIIAYGAVEFSEDISDWTPVSIDLDYRDTSRVPRYVLVVCSASKYGDYFVGGVGTWLNVDNIKLEYDY